MTSRLPVHPLSIRSDLDLQVVGELPQPSLPTNNCIPRPKVGGQGPSHLNKVPRRLPSSPIDQNWVMCPDLTQDRLRTQHPLSTAGVLLKGRGKGWMFGQKSTELPGPVETSVFFTFALFLTGDIVLSKQVSHYALPTETWWIINTSIQIPGETQMPGWDKARRCQAALGRICCPHTRSWDAGSVDRGWAGHPCVGHW